DSVTAYLTLVRVTYTEGEGETYLLPLAYAEGEHARHVQEEKRPMVVARLLWTEGISKAPREPGLLYDPTGEPGFAEAVVQAVAGRAHVAGRGGDVAGAPLSPLQELWSAEGSLPPPVLLESDRSHSTILWPEHLVLKLFRRVEEGTNPELELGRFFAER